MKNYIKKNLIVLLVATFITFISVASAGVVYAEDDDNCEPNYGGGETCIINKRFRIEKEVRLEGDDNWKDKVHIDLTDDDERDKYIEFRIKIENLTDEEADIDFDDMRMKDNLPDVFDRIGGSGLTEDWDDFEPGEDKEFKIRVELDDEEVDKDGDYERCAVNKASVYWDDEFEGSDTATVCYSNEEEEVKELPETGALANLAIAGFGLIATGTLIKKSKKVRL